MITSLGDLPNEKIVYKGHAQYVNSKNRLDTTRGVFLITTHRLIYVSKKRFIPLVKVTEFISVKLRDMSTVQTAKHGLGTRLEFKASGDKYYFLMFYMTKVTRKEDVQHVTELLETTRQQAMAL